MNQIQNKMNNRNLLSLVCIWKMLLDLGLREVYLITIKRIPERHVVPNLAIEMPSFLLLP